MNLLTTSLTFDSHRKSLVLHNENSRALKAFVSGGEREWAEGMQEGSRGPMKKRTKKDTGVGRHEHKNLAADKGVVKFTCIVTIFWVLKVFGITQHTATLTRAPGSSSFI